MSSNPSIKILSLNCWGLKHVAKDRVERIRGIADELAVSDYDIVCLQELWVHADFQYIRNQVSKVLPYAKFFFSGALGSGLAIFTRYAILETAIRPYSLNGSPLDVAGGDFFVGKSIVSVLLQHEFLGDIEVFNTHMYARGGDEGDEWYRAHRLVGAWQFANLVRASAARGRHVVATGDFNSIPTSLPMTIIQSHGGLTDAWTASHDSSLFPTESVFNPQHAIRDFGITCDSPLNTYSAGKPLSDIAKRWQGKRLDYVLFRSPSPPAGISPAADHRTRGFVCTSSRVVFTGRVPGRSFSFSDHFGLEAILEIHQSRPTSSSSMSSHQGIFNDTATPTPSLHSANAIPLSERGAGGLSPRHVNTMLSALGVAYRHARKKSNLHLVGFVGALIAAFVLIAGSAWVPRPWSPLPTLAAVVLGWAGTTLLYSGFIYGNYEVNMLVNAIEELELYRSRVEHHPSDSRDV